MAKNALLFPYKQTRQINFFGSEIIEEIGFLCYLYNKNTQKFIPMKLTDTNRFENIQNPQPNDNLIKQFKN